MAGEERQGVSGQTASTPLPRDLFGLAGAFPGKENEKKGAKEKAVTRQQVIDLTMNLKFFEEA